MLQHERVRRANDAAAWNNLRPKVRAFAEQIEMALRRNDHKGGWHGCTLEWLASKLAEECGEVASIVVRRSAIGPADQIAQECADVAAVAMMIADNAGSLGKGGAT